MNGLGLELGVPLKSCHATYDPKRRSNKDRTTSLAMIVVSIHRLGCWHYFIENTNLNMQNYKLYFNFSSNKINHNKIYDNFLKNQ
jgi:hypothetical protein